MKPTYLSQVVFCSTHDKRAFLREVAVTETDAAVTRIETLPPGYEHAMAHMRRAHEQVHRFNGNLKTLSNYEGCPYCGKRTTFECANCGSLSCISNDLPRHHACPVCGTIAEPRKVNWFTASASGFTGKQLPTLPWEDAWEERIARPDPFRNDGNDRGGRLGADYFLDVTDTKDVVRKYYDTPRNVQPPRVDIDPQIGAPPPVKGLLGPGNPEDEEKLRKALKKRFFKK